jgi:hypothetical protein
MFSYITRCSRARGLPRRSSDGADNALTTTVSRGRGAPDGDNNDNEPMWSLELASSWAHLDAACNSHAPTESDPFITIALAMPPLQHATVARASCVAEARSNKEHIARSLDGMPSLVPLSRTPRLTCYGALHMKDTRGIIFFRRATWKLSRRQRRTYFQKNKNFTPYLRCYFFSVFKPTLRNITSTADSTIAYAGFNLFRATTI